LALNVNYIARKIRYRGDDIIYIPPKTVFGWLNLTVSRPKTQGMFEGEDPFLRFRYYYLDTLTVTFHDDAGGYDYDRANPYTYQTASNNLARGLILCRRKQRTSSWVLDGLRIRSRADKI
jgi:hypothetical protein